MPRDALGRPYTPATPPRRVVSLVPSITETLFDLGAGDTLVGITDFCIFPPGLTLPRVGGTKNPRIEEIRRLAPDLVHMNLEENLARHAEAIEQFAPVFVTEPKNVDDVAQLLAQLGEIHAQPDRAAEVIAVLQRDRAALPRTPFTFAVPIWKDPWMWCGGDTYVSGLVEEAGGRNVLAAHSRYPQIEADEVLDLNPDFIFLPDEPYLFTEEDAAALRALIETRSGTSTSLSAPITTRTASPTASPTNTPVAAPTAINAGVVSPRTTPRIIGPFPGHLFTWHGTRTLLGLRFLREQSLTPLPQ